ncbi:MAG TPA: glucoamylase family protein [Coriobacteriia bacterium]
MEKTGTGQSRWRDEDLPFRGEVLPPERLAARAREEARTKIVPPSLINLPSPVAAAVSRTRRGLEATNRFLSTAVRDGTTVSAAAEWLLDNHYLVEDQVRVAAEDLPTSFAAELPRLAEGPQAGYPRIWRIAMLLLTHTDSRLDTTDIQLFLDAYQEIAPLKMSEAWALPIVLRITLADNVRRLAKRVIVDLSAGRAAEAWAERIIAALDTGPAATDAVLSELESRIVRSDVGIPFFVRLSSRLAAAEPDFGPTMRRIERAFARAGVRLEQVVTDERHQVASDQVSIANAITSIRFVEATDWHAFFERTSVVERTLRTDPAGVYSHMDFKSRDGYRHAIERLAKHTFRPEHDVAGAAIDAAAAALAADGDDMVRGHVGWYLIGKGRTGLEALLRGKEPAWPGLDEHRWWRGAAYAAMLLGLTGTLAALIGVYAWHGGSALWEATLFALLGITPLSQLATDIVNRVAAILWHPDLLPRLDTDRPVGAGRRTLVAVPVLLTSPASVAAVLDHLEADHLANPDPDIGFALLGELKAAPTRHVPADDAIIDAAVSGIAALNDRYGRNGPGSFHLLLRERKHNQAEDVWMGWEHKRGALEELNHYLRGATDTSITTTAGDEGFLAGVSFVITLDADTVLPMGAARSLICTIAHPLNRAYVDPDRMTVTHGYGVVQPRVAATLDSAVATRFAGLNAGPTGLDQYSGTVSETYQDVFGEGSFIGKGIYEVDVYNTVLKGRIPDETLLSHDLLEGNFLRTAFASDIELFDEYPPDYGTQCSRLHRWTRGDWQAAQWLRRHVKGSDGATYRNPLSPLHKWKLLENLRRSILPASLVIWGLSGGLLLRRPGMWWVPVLALVIGYPLMLQVVHTFFGLLGGGSLSAIWRPLREDAAADAKRALLELAFLPHQGLLLLDATTRALWRMLVSHRRMLEWVTAAEAQASATNKVGAYVHLMGPSMAIAVALAAGVVFRAPLTALFLVPIAMLWIASPVLAWWISRPRPTDAQADASPAEIAQMRMLARRTWGFFETFVGAGDSWLPPDNFQEDPEGVVAHRTSPTNIGLALLSNLTAHDLGYQCLSGTVGRTAHTMETLQALERFRGHFYNWYDTLTLAPLRPTYVSTVDSGNLAGALITLREGLHGLTDAPLIGPAALDGILDSILLAIEDLGRQTQNELISELRGDLDELARKVRLTERPVSLPGWHRLISSLARSADEAHGRAVSGSGEDSLASTVTSAAAAAIRPHLSDIETLAPWAGPVSHPPIGILSGPLALLTERVPSLRSLADDPGTLIACLDDLAATGTVETAAWASEVSSGLRVGADASAAMLAHTLSLADAASAFWDGMDFSLVYDRSRELFSIGFNTEQGKCDDSYYDLLASECRLTSYLAVARGDVPLAHWFRLGRMLTRTGHEFALLSWSASMFEYLMPLLLMRTWKDTLLDRTYRAIVQRQIEYGRERGVPWGVSESAFNARDTALTYQYRAFGVPGLGLKRGLSDDIVVAPYATVLAAQVDRPAALANLHALVADGALGRYGFYEAIDYTPGRLEAGARRAVVMTYMAHHQGMSLLALGNEITSEAMQRRFHADPLVASAELLLQESVPRIVEPAHPHFDEVEFVRTRREPPPPVERSYPTPDTATPATHFLSNGRYSVMVTNAGGGYSRWSELAVSRYREDITRDCWGQFIYLRDVATGRLWSAMHQPVCAPADDYHCSMAAGRAEYRRQDSDIETHTEITVSPEDDIEVRRVSITNHGRIKVTLEVTSYFEVTLAVQGADQAHRAFSNLFVETEWLPELRSILFTRRPRSSDEPRRWGLHTLATDVPEQEPCSVETDRQRFLGRGRQARDAAAAYAGGPLSGTVGAVLDPICSIRRVVRIEPGQTVRLAFSTGVATTREQALSLAEEYGDARAVQRAIDLAWGTGEIELRDFGIKPADAITYQRLASRLLLTDRYSRLKLKPRRENRLPISGLWGLGISGDHPILLVRIERLEDTPFVRQLLLAHRYWRHQGFRVDLVVLNTKPSAYVSELDDRLQTLVRSGSALQMLGQPGGVFLRQADQIDPAILTLLESVARVALDADAGPVKLQLDRRVTRPSPPALLVPTRPATGAPTPQPERPTLLADCGYGGIDPDTGEYVIVLEHGENTPAPWINVIAMPEFGTMVSEAGVGCTWALNSHENRLTTWNNDAVSDGTGELFYVRDEESGEVWSPTPLPVRDNDTYIVRHGRGQTTFEHATHGIAHRLRWFVPVDDPVRVAALTLTNLGTEPRRLSITHFVEWVLGDSRSKASQRVSTSYDTEGRMLVARSYFNEDFPGRVAFLACDRRVHSYTADRTEFLGRNGTPASPAALRRIGLGGLAGRYRDNCGALMSCLTIDPGESAEIRFFLGECDTFDHARQVVERYRRPDTVDHESARVKEFWDGVLDTLVVSTPDPLFDAMANGRALYQALACRLWGRTALYQSSGAYGFRDQLQDVSALTLARPDLARAHILEASRHQFAEGDALHWWQPYSGRGVRTRFKDDRLWLPYTVADYVFSTGDTSILDEEVPFIMGPPVPEDREDLYLVPQESSETATLYEHCLRAFDVSRDVGEHGLPLIGGGDWNDGMNRVGHEGRGESVWLAWFLVTGLRRFAPICEQRGDGGRAEDLRAWADRLVAAVEREAWDGAWYRRAYFDDGTPLGTRTADECRIDAVAQAWAVISGAGDPQRARTALDSVEEKLVRREAGLIALLTPPFDHMEHDPGYIKGYVPGVRENGGQYTHAALWVVMAYALMGDGDKAVGLLDLLNPFAHARTRGDADIYRVEPYTVVADVYAVRPHVGRGGWSWYTGSAALFHNTAIQSILGIRTSGGAGGRILTVDPTIPKAWPGFEATLRLGSTTWRIRVDNPRGANRGVERTTLDGAPVPDGHIPLTDDGSDHSVVIYMLGG